LLLPGRRVGPPGDSASVTRSLTATHPPSSAMVSGRGSCCCGKWRATGPENGSSYPRGAWSQRGGRAAPRPVSCRRPPHPCPCVPSVFFLPAGLRPRSSRPRGAGRGSYSSPPPGVDRSSPAAVGTQTTCRVPSRAGRMTTSPRSSRSGSMRPSASSSPTISLTVGSISVLSAWAAPGGLSAAAGCGAGVLRLSRGGSPPPAPR